MLTSDPIVASAEIVDAAKTFLRLDGDEDDALIAALSAAAVAECESFLGEPMLMRGFAETRTVDAQWQRLGTPNVIAITGVTALDGTAVSSGSYQTDIDPEGNGLIRATGSAPLRLKIAFRAGFASQWAGIPEVVRLGIVRLIAFHHGARDRLDDPVTPVGVRAMWQHRRRMRVQ